MDRKELLEKVFYSSTSRVLREEEILNVFGVADLNDIPTDKLVEYCNKYYCTGGDKNGS